ncbi:FHA domain protein, putative (macronuclear) [Tetrahymena thermophila SB210]|uniref:FHA domain protein, putative n=1 Tax=Tetrahymena thermophila (strain SB210) TaxID=312017 RepID=Q22YH3_TETTS|nr:FHA domain protein, putative [Tetrahymena thermophila SB210]EAR90312.2 FHA domain protein, putative [Tetrahymena thermophila SB210]|eukprot:XP_001010557.2 FHA domain protein, putative [Tetrahymena thermophila SB210]
MGCLRYSKDLLQKYLIKLKVIKNNKLIDFFLITQKMTSHLPISLVQLDKNLKESLDSYQVSKEKGLADDNIGHLNQITIQTEINSNEDSNLNCKQHQHDQKQKKNILISSKYEQNIQKSYRSSQDLDRPDQKQQIGNINKIRSPYLTKICSSPNLVCQSGNSQFEKTDFVCLEMKNVKDNRFCQDNRENKAEEQVYCRICLDSQSDSETGQLQNVCSCNGSLKYIHHQCLWYYIEKKINNQIEQSFPLQVQCELCKESYRIQFEMITQANPAQVVKQNFIRQSQPYSLFFILIFVLFIISVILFQRAVQESKVDVSVLITYFFFSFAMTSVVVSILFIIYIFYCSYFSQALVIKKIFPSIQEYQEYIQKCKQLLQKNNKMIDQSK